MLWPTRARRAGFEPRVLGIVRDAGIRAAGLKLERIESMLADEVAVDARRVPLSTSATVMG